MRLLAGRQRVAGLGVVELAERDGLAGRGRAALLGHLADQLEHAGDAAGLLARASCSVVPSPIWPDSTRATDILPPCAVWKRLQHVGDRLAAGLDAEPLGGRRDARRLVAQRLEQAQHAVGAGGDADQHRADQAVAQLLGEIVEHLVARRRDVLEQLLHQLVVVVGERLQHGEARVLLAVEIVAFERDHLGRRVLLVDKGALEREIDEAGDDVVLPDRDLAQHQRHARGRLQQLAASRARAWSALSILLRNRKRGIFSSSSSRRISCSCGTFFSSASQTTTAASTAGSTARMSWTNSTEPGQSMKV